MRSGSCPDLGSVSALRSNLYLSPCSLSDFSSHHPVHGSLYYPVEGGRDLVSPSSLLHRDFPICDFGITLGFPCFLFFDSLQPWSCRAVSSHFVFLTRSRLKTASSQIAGSVLVPLLLDLSLPSPSQFILICLRNI